MRLFPGSDCKGFREGGVCAKLLTLKTGGSDATSSRELELVGMSATGPITSVSVMRRFVCKMNSGSDRRW